MIKLKQGRVEIVGTVNEILAETCTLLEALEERLGRQSAIPPILASFYAGKCGDDTESQIKVLKYFKKDVQLALEELDFSFKNKEISKKFRETGDEEEDD